MPSAVCFIGMIKKSILSKLNYTVEKNCRAGMDKNHILEKIHFELDDEFGELNGFIYTLRIFVDDLLICSWTTSFDPRKEDEKYIIEAEEADYLLDKYENLDNEIFKDFWLKAEKSQSSLCSKLCFLYGISRDYADLIYSMLLYIFVYTQGVFLLNIQ